MEKISETESSGKSSSNVGKQVILPEREDSTLDDSIHFNTNEQEVVVQDDGIEKAAISCLRFFVLFLMIGSTIGAGVATWKFLSSQEQEDFNKEFDVIAEDIKQLSYRRMTEKADDFASLASTLTGLAINSNTIWPFFTDSNLPMIVSNFMATTGAGLVFLAPLVQGEQEREKWANYSQQNQGWIADGVEFTKQQGLLNVSDIYPTIFRRSNGENVAEEGSGPFLPLWQFFPSRDSPLVNFNMLSDPHYKEVFNSVVESKELAMTDYLGITNQDLVELSGPDTQYLVSVQPTSLFLTPVFKDSTNQEVVAILNSDVSWLPMFARASDEDIPPVDVVIDEGCQRRITIRITAQKAEFIGFVDSHDSTYDDYEVAFPFAPDVPSHHLAGPDCSYTIRVFPTKEFWEIYHTSNPGTTAGIVTAAFFFIGIIFYLYDAAVHFRQKRILRVASQSEQILSVLYPKSIRDRLFGIEEKKEEEHKSVPTTKRKQMKEDLIKASRYQLKHFMKSSSPSGQGDSLEGFGSKPIADLFLNATVIFADIAGFTAWSSVREPAQVFTLLETVYRAFDTIAKRKKVFKVETVGDCYVAVTGLPEPTKAHASIMAGFARDCVSRFVDLVSVLETTLGPDTGDLGIRVGMHSGPVTAGVLRGDKSRFQLFGDTVNTAARIESTGMRNRIQMSEETADLLAAAGKVHWLRRRDEVVTAKGKGKLQTYWLLTKEEERAEMEAAADKLSSENDNRAVIQEQINQAPLDIKTCTLEEVESLLSPKVRRLCKWNVDVLAKLLRQIIAHRNSSDAVHSSNEDVLSERESEIRDQYMVLDEVVEIIPLPGFDPRVYREQQNPEEVHLPDAVIDQMRLYVACMATMYRDNAFHNFEHASHVMMSVSKLLSRIVSADDVFNADENAAMSRNLQWSIHDHTYGITSDPMTQFSVILAALVHDLDHLGVSNAQLVKENHKLAKVFKSQSVAEQNSIVLAWDILMDERFHDFRRMIYTAPFELERFRQLMANTVLATDIFDKQLNTLRRKRWDLAFHGSASALQQAEDTTRDNVNRKATIVIEHLIQASDVSHTMQHWHIYCKWNERLFQEMTAAHKAGRLAFDPAEKWYEGEMGFFDNYVIPLAKKLKECGVFGVASDEYLNYAMENRREWEEKGQEFVADLVRKHGQKKSTSSRLSKSPKRNSRRMSLTVGYMSKVESA
ncbi:unnamed protein product [Cylindrotheca closterium]|uniref:Phosphodiesterase n=1 Tax=Cylindrotheca closterium TaxID=2856 RepID=A0AAD2G5Y9_9STRA|nr:unnamed protein product [Cylindrotheca closterium]